MGGEGSGDLPGHEFRGNQWTSGQGTNAEFKHGDIKLTATTVGWQNFHILKAVGKHNKKLYHRRVGDENFSKILFDKLKTNIVAGKSLDDVWLSEDEQNALFTPKENELSKYVRETLKKYS